MKRVPEGKKEDDKKKQNPFATEELLENEKKRIRGILDEPRAIAQSMPNDPNGTKQVREQFRLDFNATNAKIEKIFSTFILSDITIKDENDNLLPPQHIVKTSNTSSGIWKALQSSVQDPFWLEVVTALNFPDVKAIKRIETKDGRFLRVSTFTAEDIRRIGIGDGLFRELIDQYDTSTLIQYGDADEQESLNVMKGMFIEYLLGFNEESALNFLSLFVTYLEKLGRRAPVDMMILTRKHDNKGLDETADMDINTVLYEEENSYIYLTHLDLFRKEKISRYRFYQSNLGLSNNNNDNTININTNVYAPLNITLDNGEPTSIDCPGNILRIIKFYNNDKLLIYVTVYTGNNDFLLKIHCDDFTKIERVDKISIGVASSQFNDVNFLDANSLYDAKYCSTLKAINSSIEEIKLLNLTLLGSTENFVPLTENESTTFKKYQIEFHPKFGSVVEEATLKKDTSKEGKEKYNRYKEYVKLEDRKKSNTNRGLFQPLDNFLKVGILDTGYYDSTESPVDDRKRVLAAKIVSIPIYRKQADFFILALIGINAENTLSLYMMKFQRNNRISGYKTFGSAYEKELTVMDLPGKDVSYDITDFNFYFYTDETFYIELQIHEKNVEFSLLEFDVATYFRCTTDMTSKFIFGDNTAPVPMPDIPSRPFLEKMKSYNYKVLKYGNEKTENLVKYDHVFYRNNATLTGCRFIFTKLLSAIPSIYIVDVEDINMMDIITITPFAEQFDGYAYITVSTKNIKSPIRIIKILKGTGYKEYDVNDSDTRFLRSAFQNISLHNGGEEKEVIPTKSEHKCSLCGNSTTKFDRLASNYYCHSLCQYLFVMTRRMNI